MSSATHALDPQYMGIAPAWAFAKALGSPGGMRWLDCEVVKNADGDPVGKHFANFIEPVRARDPRRLHGPVETAHTSSALAHLGNIAYRVGRRLKFDPASERFVGDSEADALLTREYRKPYAVPDQV